MGTLWDPKIDLIGNVHVPGKVGLLSMDGGCVGMDASMDGGRLQHHI